MSYYIILYYIILYYIILYYVLTDKQFVKQTNSINLLHGNNSKNKLHKQTVTEAVLSEHASRMSACLSVYLSVCALRQQQIHSVK
jgi:hypothetical protein